MKRLYVSMMRLTLVGVVCCELASFVWAAEPLPGSAEIPLQYIGPQLPDPEAVDGHLMYCPGVQNIQISRVNRTHPYDLQPESENAKGWTYQHHVGLACWKGLLYAVWDMSHVHEDVPPFHVVYSTSSDGFHWSAPKDLFPFGQAWNQRFYFYHASNGRMLAFACGANPGNGTRKILEAKKKTLLVREVKADHTLGRVYTLVNPVPSLPPIYTESKDAGFVAACIEAYNNKPLLEQQDFGVYLGDRRMKWHDARNWPGGSKQVDDYDFGKGFCFFHRKDGTLVGLCKMGFATESTDEGKTWSLPVIPKGLIAGSGKVWAQKTPDGRYAMVYVPQRRHRYPMAVTTSDDGVTFRNMRTVHGEVPPVRYGEEEGKNIGPQYPRGVAEWGGDAQWLDKHSIWVIYGMNQEDIWISRIAVPIKAGEIEPVNDDFDNVAVGPLVPRWHTYSPAWGPVGIAAEGKNHYLELEDREPTDYARAIRVFPISKSVDVSFRLAAGQTDRGRLEIELLGTENERPVRIVLNNKGRIEAVDGEQPLVQSFAPGLTGIYFHKANFRDLDNDTDVLQNLDQYWGKRKGNDWRARWTGFIEGPYSGEVTFTAKATDGLRLKIGNQVVIDGLGVEGSRMGKVIMDKGLKTPITLEFTSAKGKADLHLWWAWPGRTPEIIPASALSCKQKPEIRPIDLMAYKADTWQTIQIHADCDGGKYALAVNGKELLKGVKFAEPASELYAISLRTGKFRGYPDPRKRRDIPNTEEPAPPVSYRIDDVMTGK